MHVCTFGFGGQETEWVGWEKQEGDEGIPVHDCQGVSNDLKPPRKPFLTSVPGNEPHYQNNQCLSILIPDRSHPDASRYNIKEPEASRKVLQHDSKHPDVSK